MRVRGDGGDKDGKKLRGRLKRNPKLLFAFRLCLKLGIDDPIAWFDSVPPSLVNAWMAYYTIEPWETGSNPEDEKERKMMKPEQALARLQMRIG